MPTVQMLWSVFDKSIVQGILKGTYRHSEKIRPVLGRAVVFSTDSSVEITQDKKEELVKLEKWQSFAKWFNPLGIPKEPYFSSDKESTGFEYTLDVICSIAGER